MCVCVFKNAIGQDESWESRPLVFSWPQTALSTFLWGHSTERVLSLPYMGHPDTQHNTPHISNSNQHGINGKTPVIAAMTIKMIWTLKSHLMNDTGAFFKNQLFWYFQIFPIISQGEFSSQRWSSRSHERFYIQLVLKEQFTQKYLH